MNSSDAITIEGVRVSNPDRVLFPRQGVTKRDLIDYYLAISDELLAHAAHRPLSLVRCPEGRSGNCFYQKHASAGFPGALRTITIEEKTGRGEYLYVDSPAGLVAAVQMGVLELHIWGARVDRLEQPDRLVFDLDPDEAIAFERVKDAAREMRARLDDQGLASFVLATGGKGLHVVVPVERGHGWAEHRSFAKAVARAMAADSPDHYVATVAKAKRRGKVFIDYLRNDRGNTAIAPFSTRARSGAPVAFPLSWRALGRLESARGVTIATAVARLGRYKGHPWEGYGATRQALPRDGRANR